MKYNKKYLRKKFLLKRKKSYLKVKKINFTPIFSLIKKHFNKKKITIAAYYPSNYEVNILSFLKEASKKKIKLSLPLIESSTKINFKRWIFKDPLYVSKFGILEPQNLEKNVIPDFILVPLVAFDNSLNRIGYGKGYYDRSLKKISMNKKKMISVGIAYSSQKCKRIPVNKHDYKLDYIFTERGVISSN